MMLKFYGLVKKAWSSNHKDECEIFVKRRIDDVFVPFTYYASALQA